MTTNRRPIAVIVGATSKWQADGRNTKLAHGSEVDASGLPVGARWGIGGALAQRFASEGFLVVLTTRHAANAAGLEAAVRDQHGEAMVVELDLTSEHSVATAFARIREQAGDPEVLIYNAGYLEGRDLPPEVWTVIDKYPPAEEIAAIEAELQSPFDDRRAAAERALSYRS
jgi:NAD(P)-dependent dehydrogenase (short-subunit alcohol dehydrogenase family)